VGPRAGLDAVVKRKFSSPAGGSRLLHPQPEGAPCYGDRDPLNMVLIPIYSQLPSISGGRLLHPQPEDAPCYGDRST
jgi:hypothetical protein